MNQLKPAALATIFSEALANLAFMFTEEDASEPTPVDGWMEATISYRGPVGGTFHLRCTREFAVLLAANLLGIDAENTDAESKAEDAVKEFMKVLCGQFVTTVHGAEPDFDLSIPEVHEMSKGPDLALPESPTLSTLVVEGHRVQLATVPHEV